MKRFLTAILLLVTLPVFAAKKDEWADFYKKGLTAGTAKDWATVNDQMTRAVALKPAEELSARAKNEILVYVPHFWLGIAKLNLGDVEGSLSEFQTSQNQGVIQNTQYYSDFRAWLSRAQAAKQKKLADAAAPTRRLADAAIEKAFLAQTEALTAGAGRLDSYRAAGRELNSAVEQLGKAGTDTEALKKVAAAADRAREMFNGAKDEAVARKNKPVQPVQPQQQQPPPPPPPPAIPTELLQNAKISIEELRGKLNAAKKEFRDDKSLQTFISASLKQVNEWDTVVAEAQDRRLVDNVVQESANTSRLLDDKIGMLRAASAAAAAAPEPMPAKAAPTAANKQAIRSQLTSAYRAYAKGNFDGCEKVITGLIASKGANDEAYLLRGVARYTKAMLSNEQVLLRSAATDFASALRLNPGVSLDPKLFSPKLVSFFNEVRKKNAGVR